MLLHATALSRPSLCVCLCVQVRYRLVNLTSTTLCDVGEVKPDSVKGAAVCVMRGECDFSQKAQVAQQLGVTVLLIASKVAMVLTPHYEITPSDFTHHFDLYFLVAL